MVSSIGCSRRPQLDKYWRWKHCKGVMLLKITEEGNRSFDVGISTRVLSISIFALTVALSLAAST
jgi:hypothetical protein